MGPAARSAGRGVVLRAGRQIGHLDEGEDEAISQNVTLLTIDSPESSMKFREVLGGPNARWICRYNQHKRNGLIYRFDVMDPHAIV